MSLRRSSADCETASWALLWQLMPMRGQAAAKAGAPKTVKISESVG